MVVGSTSLAADHSTPVVVGHIVLAAAHNILVVEEGRIDPVEDMALHYMDLRRNVVSAVVVEDNSAADLKAHYIY